MPKRAARQGIIWGLAGALFFLQFLYVYEVNSSYCSPNSSSATTVTLTRSYLLQRLRRWRWPDAAFYCFFFLRRGWCVFKSDESLKNTKIGTAPYPTCYIYHDDDLWRTTGSFYKHTNLFQSVRPIFSTRSSSSWRSLFRFLPVPVSAFAGLCTIYEREEK